MASISNVQLSLIPGGDEIFVEVSYTVSATNLDASSGQAYREEVFLIGVDEGPHEDGQSEILGEPIHDATLQFNPNFQGLTTTRAKKVPPALLDEDSGLFRTDEIRARVMLTPLPPGVVTADSNTVVRFSGPLPVIEPVMG